MTARRRARPAATGPEADMLADLARSLLTAEHAAAMRCAVVPAEAMAEMELPRKPAYALPYFDLDGRPTGFCRWRFLEDTRSAWERETDKKPLRYAQPPSTMPELYLPPLIDWRRIAEDPAVPLVITEGEKKAACLTALGRPCAGLGGVYSFKSTKRGQPLIRHLREFDWKDRDVVVCYDSDAHTNPMVVAARNELCRTLLELGALPRIADLPGAEDGAKRGLDDVAAQDGADYLLECLDAAQSYAASAALHDLNGEVAYVRDPGLVVVLEDGRQMRATDFAHHAYANRHYYEESMTADGKPKLTKKSAATAWLQWERRFELARMTYRPGADRVTPDGCYNTWKGWGCEPRKGPVGPWRKLLDRLFDGFPEERRWFERWCALPLQRPGAKMFTCALLWGVETGTGKSLVGKTLGRIYGENYVLIGDKELQDGRNEWARNRQFVMGDDVTGQEQRKYADRLKAMITQEMIRIDVKYVPSYSVPDLINYLFTSNHPDAMFLEDRDRRDFVHEVSSRPMSRAETDEYFAWLDGGGASHLFHHLLHLDVGEQRPEDRAPETAARAAMIDDGHSQLARWVRRLRDAPDAVLTAGTAALAGDLWTSQDLVRVYDPGEQTRTTASAMSRELKRAGLRQVYGGNQVRMADGTLARLFAVRDAERWLKEQKSERVRAHYAETVGAVAKRRPSKA